MQKGIPAFLLIILLVFPGGCKQEPSLPLLEVQVEDQWFDATLAAVGSLQFTQLPLLQENINRIYPLGYMGTHIFPADHIYLIPKTTNTDPVSVYAPADGIIHYIEQPEESSSAYHDNSIRIAITKNITYILGHLHVDPDLAVGQNIQAGTYLGTCVTLSSLDLLVLDRNNRNSCTNIHYPFTVVYAQSPFSYASEEVRMRMLEAVYPFTPIKQEPYNPENEHAPNLTGEHIDTYLPEEALLDEEEIDRDLLFKQHYFGLQETYRATEGSFEYDREGTLQGNWFSIDETTGVWDEGIAFAFDLWFPTQPRIRIKDAFGDIEKTYFAIQRDEPDFVEVTESMSVLYSLYDPQLINWHGFPIGSPLGKLRVVMLGPTRIQVEIFSVSSGDAPPFTNQARYYYR